MGHRVRHRVIGSFNRVCHKVRSDTGSQGQTHGQTQGQVRWWTDRCEAAGVVVLIQNLF